jgi:predicted nucleic acid-binding protein
VAGLTLDSGALIQYERGDPRVRAWLEVAFERGDVPTVPAATIAETYRGAQSARIAQLIKKCNVESLDESLAREAGILRASVPGSTAIDAIVVASAATRGDVVLTTDPGDLAALCEKVAGVTVEAV